MTAGTIEFKLGGTIRFIADQAPNQAGVFVSVKYENFTLKARAEQMAYTLPNDKTINMQISYVDAKGNAAAIDDEVQWTSSDAAVLSLKVDPQDSTIVGLMPVGPAAQVQVSATADADLGDGVRNIVTVLDVQVVAGEAVSGTIAPIGEQQPIAPHAEPRKK
jgi:hypothetical protein